MLSVEKATEAIAFYKEAFDATETVRMTDEAGRIAHAEICISNVPLMVSDTYPEAGAVSPARLGGSPVILLLDVPDVDTAFARTIAAGATLERPIQGITIGKHSEIIALLRKAGAKPHLAGHEITKQTNKRSDRGRHSETHRLVEIGRKGRYS